MDSTFSASVTLSVPCSSSISSAEIYTVYSLMHTYQIKKFISNNFTDIKTACWLKKRLEDFIETLMEWRRS